MARFYPTPFASAGARLAIPDVDPGDGSVSYPTGWGPEYELDQTGPGNPRDIPRDSENDFKHDITEFAGEVEVAGILPYQNDFNYVLGAVVQGSDEVLYRANSLNGPATTIVDPVGDLTAVWGPALADINDYSALVVYVVSNYAKGSDALLYRAAIANGPGTGAGVVDPVGDLTQTWFAIGGAAQPIKTTVFTVSDPTFTPTFGAKFMKVIVTGGGGGGGGGDTAGAPEVSYGSAGGAGATAIKTFSVDDASYAIVVGAGGAGGVGLNTGATGGTSSMNGATLPIVTALGGVGGNTNATNSATAGRVDGVDGGVATGGDINIQGGGSGAGINIIANTAITSVSMAGGSHWGGGPREVPPDSGNVNGVDALTQGAGGGAAIVTITGSASANGGAGGPGVVVLEEYF